MYPVMQIWQMRMKWTNLNAMENKFQLETSFVPLRIKGIKCIFGLDFQGFFYG